VRRLLILTLCFWCLFVGVAFGATPRVFYNLSGSDDSTASVFGSLWVPFYQFGVDNVTMDAKSGTVTNHTSGQPSTEWYYSWTYNPAVSNLATEVVTSERPVMAYEFSERFSYSGDAPTDDANTSGIDVAGSVVSDGFDSSGSTYDYHGGLRLQGAWGTGYVESYATGSGGSEAATRTPLTQQKVISGKVIQSMLVLLVPRQAGGWAMYAYGGTLIEGSRVGGLVWQFPMYIAATDEIARQRLDDIAARNHAQGFAAWKSGGNWQEWRWRTDILRMEGSQSMSVKEAQDLMASIPDIDLTEFGDNLPESSEVSTITADPDDALWDSLPDGLIPDWVRSWFEDNVTGRISEGVAGVTDLFWFLELHDEMVGVGGAP